MRVRLNRRIIMLILVAFMMFVLIPFSFASEINDADAIMMDENIDLNDGSDFSVDADNICMDGNILKNDSTLGNSYLPSSEDDLKTSDVGVWEDLSKDIQNLKPGDVYNFEHDYKKPDNAFVSGININVDNVTINGNGHILEGNSKNYIRSAENKIGLGTFFTVSGNNVKINNLTFKNGGYDLDEDSPTVKSIVSSFSQLFGSIDINAFSCGVNFNKLDVISHSALCWLGNDGLCSGCRFFNNKASVGSSLSWFGNNGVLNDSVFLNNSASRLGGAIYLDGVNCTIFNSYFLNSSSQWANDSICLGLDYDNGVFKEIHSTGNGSDFFFDSHISGFDPLEPSTKLNVLGTQIDFAKSMFNVLTFGDVNTFKDISYFGQILNGTDFLLTFIKNFDDGIVIDQEFHFANVTHDNLTALIADTVFKAFDARNFTVNFIYLNYVNVSNIGDYENALKLNGDNVFGKYLNLYNEYKDSMGASHVTCVKGLRVDFLGKYTFKNHSTWKPMDMGFNTLYINGHDSTIIGDAEDRDEYKWASLEGNCTLTVNNLNITQFNNAIFNDGGFCILNNAVFYKNRMDYYIERDWGAAILNAGTCICTNCTFLDNYCSNGGAIFSQGCLRLDDCTFKGNDAYRNGDDVLSIKDTDVYIDGKQLNCSLGVVEFRDVTSTKDTVLKIGSIAFSALVGVVVGVVTLNPVVAVASGVGTALVLGPLVGTYLSTTHYDVHYNALKGTLILTAECVAAGIIGGLIGAYGGSLIRGAPEVEIGSQWGLDDDYLLIDSISEMG